MPLTPHCNVWLKNSLKYFIFSLSFLLVSQKLIMKQDDLAKADKFLADSMSRLMLSTNPEEAVGQSDLVIEAIVEKLKIKQNLFKTLDNVSNSLYFSSLITYQEIFSIGCSHSYYFCLKYFFFAHWGDCRSYRKKRQICWFTFFQSSKLYLVSI